MKLISIFMVACLSISGFAGFIGDVAGAEPQVLQKPVDTSIPYRNDTIVGKTQIIKVIVGFSIAILIALAVLYLLRRYYFSHASGKSVHKRVQIHEVRRLTPKMTLLIVSVDKKNYTLVQCGENVQVLDCNCEELD